MTTIDLYRKHKAGGVSREKFLYEVRRDNNLPFITNLTSYDDAVKILKNKGIVTEETKEAKADEAVKAEVKPKSLSEKNPKTLHLDVAHPYEYRLGLQQELNTIGEYTDEALEKAKETVLKNLAKDANFYTTLLNAKTSPYTFKKTETDEKGMQARPDGYLKKEAKKDEKSNVKDNLGNKEAGTTKPKGITIMPDKGVTGSEKTIKEGIEISDLKKGDTVEYEGNKYKIGDFDTAGGANLVYLNTMDGKPAEDSKGRYKKVHKSRVKKINEGLEELKEKAINKYINAEMEDGEEYLMLNKTAVSNYLKSVIDPEEIESVDAFMDDEEGFDESSSYFFDTDEENASEKDVEDWAKQEMSYYLFSSPDEFPSKDTMEEGLETNDLEVKWTEKYLDNEKKDPYFYTEKGLANRFQMRDGKKVKEIIGYYVPEDAEKENDEEFDIIGYIYSTSGKDIENEYSEDDLDDAFTGALGSMNEGSFMSGVDLGSSFDKMKQDIVGNKEDFELADENAFEDLMKKYDWYYEMSDDSRAYDSGKEIDQKLKVLTKKIGIERAVELFNQKAPQDRKANASFFTMNEDKHAKLKEALKTALKKKVTEDTATNDLAKKSAIQTEKAKILALNKQKSELNADTTKTPAIKNAEKQEIDLKLRTSNDTLTKLNQGKINVV